MCATANFAVGNSPYNLATNLCPTATPQCSFPSIHPTNSLPDWPVHQAKDITAVCSSMSLGGNMPTQIPTSLEMLGSGGLLEISVARTSNFSTGSSHWKINTPAGTIFKQCLHKKCPARKCPSSEGESQSRSTKRCISCPATKTISSSQGNGALLDKRSAMKDFPLVCASNGASVEKKVAVVWFKHDLRIDDHIGLAAALQYERVVPLFIFDTYFHGGQSSALQLVFIDHSKYGESRQLIRKLERTERREEFGLEALSNHRKEYNLGWTRELLESLFDAVLDLRRSLRSINSDLLIRRGRSKDVILALAHEVNATDIITEEEIEQAWHDLVGSVAASLSVESLSGQTTTLKSWRAPLFDLEGLVDVTDNYKEFKRLRRPALSPIGPSTSMPSLGKEIDRGALVNMDEFCASIDAVQRENPFWETLKAAQEQSAESLLLPKSLFINGHARHQTKAPNRVLQNQALWKDEKPNELPYNFKWEYRSQRDPDVENRSELCAVKGGATRALEMLHEYLRALEATDRGFSRTMYEHIMDLEKRPGASFRAIFNYALTLGTLSHRRVYFEAMKYEKERGGGHISPFGFSTFTAATAVTDVKSIEWHEMLQRKSRDQGSDSGLQVGSWRWRGYLIQYSKLGEEGPAVVLIHGFGAFWEHYRDNIPGLAKKGNRVWGLTMVGFGRSEKPTIAYTELLLAELVRDFIVEVVKEPVALAGNSIGGYTTCVVAGLWPDLVNSLVLLNTAGLVVPNYQSLSYRKPREKSFIAKRGAQVLLVYLQYLSIRLLKRCYPHKTGRVDPWLQSEVMRPSFDPGSTAVLESIFHLNRPLPLNFYLDRYNGKVLVVQGTRDPLHNSAKRAATMQMHCSNVTIRYLNAGHCPHDELPDEVNALLHNWMRISTPQATLDTADFKLPCDIKEDGLREDTRAVPNGEVHVTKSDWFSYFNR